MLAGAPTTLQVAHVGTAFPEAQGQGNVYTHQILFPLKPSQSCQVVATVALQKVGVMNLSKEGNQIRSCNSWSLERD